jgi:protein TonB
VQGQVTVRACVCEHGRVVDARIETSIPLLDPAAIEAVRQWTFQPASSGDVLVPCWIDVPVRFSLH